MMLGALNLIPAPFRVYALVAIVAFVAIGAGTAAWQLRDVFADRDIAQLELGYEKTRLAMMEAVVESRDAARAAETAERTRNTQIEVRANENAKRTQTLLADNRRLARELGGLRDPYALARGGCMSRETGATGDIEDRAAEGRFSVEATEFLLEFAAQCDAAADYAQAGHAYAGKELGE